jgi:hypothetical protein
MTLPRYTESEFLEHARRTATPEMRTWIDAGKLVPRACSCSYPACRGWQLDWTSPADRDAAFARMGLPLPPERSPVTAG